MTSTIMEFLILGRAVGFGLVIYGIYLDVPSRRKSVLQLLASPYDAN
ncbi:hypothetical protein [Caballeronia sordidicola]|uniref:Uncharacterized protein n=1 Tax=Caballeronia sordidicola TaxID=196367 RepID=A0A242MUE6_CABSO|nr:hypothetical protein [Caballeronia sordidicola]OTP74451.1 hypothetical protein PAMC26510_16555 [Caballeronia sordidicola]